MYHCANCQAERDIEKREMVGDILHLKIIYECGSYREMRRVGHVWKHIGDVYKCKHLTLNTRLAG